MKVYPRFQRGKEARKDFKRLLRFCRPIKSKDKYGKYVYFEYDGSLDEFAKSWNESFQVEINQEEFCILLGLKYFDPHNGIGNMTSEPSVNSVLKFMERVNEFEKRSRKSNLLVGQK